MNLRRYMKENGLHTGKQLLLLACIWGGGLMIVILLSPFLLPLLLVGEAQIKWADWRRRQQKKLQEYLEMEGRG